MICVVGFTDVLLKASFCHLDGHPTIIQDITGRFSHCLGRFLGVLSLSSILQLIIQFSLWGCSGLDVDFPCFVCGPMEGNIG